jgi:peptide/nickel transport system permease protein
MGWFVLRRLAGAVAVLLIVPSLSFVFFTVSYRGGPVFSQLWDYLHATFITRDLGRSEVVGQPSVGRLLRDGVPIDVALLLGGFGLGIAGGVLAGAAVARRPRSRRAAVLNWLAALALSAPVYATGFLVVVYFGSVGGEHPLFFVSDQGQYVSVARDPIEWLHALWVPWLAVALPVGGAVMRLTNGATRDALGEDPVRTARAKGANGERVLRRHALPFAVPSLSAYVGASMNLMILNIAVMETTFNLPGSFRYAREAINNVDFTLIQGLVLVAVIYVVAANLIADLVLMRVDPRTRER